MVARDTTIAIRATMRPYSTAVAPLSSPVNFMIRLRMLSLPGMSVSRLRGVTVIALAD